MNNNPVLMEDQVPSSKQYVTPGQMPQENNYFTDPTGPRYQNPAEFDQAMASQTPQPQQPGVQFNVPDFEAMRKEALQQAIQQVTQAPAPAPVPQVQQPQQMQVEPKIVYVRRNLTLAEILVIFALASGLVLGVQGIWSFATDILPRIEIRDK